MGHKSLRVPSCCARIGRRGIALQIQGSELPLATAKAVHAGTSVFRSQVSLSVRCLSLILTSLRHLGRVVLSRLVERFQRPLAVGIRTEVVALIQVAPKTVDPA